MSTECLLLPAVVYFCLQFSDQVEARNEVVSAKLTELTKQNSSLQSQLTEMEKNTNKVGGAQVAN